MHRLQYNRAMSNIETTKTITTEKELSVSTAIMMEPDVAVIVGGVKFYHHSVDLCRASDFFKVALDSGMKESSQLVIEFPDKDPDEWRTVSPFLEPYFTPNKIPMPRIACDIVDIVVPWFHYLGLTKLLDDCEQVYLKSLTKACSSGPSNNIDIHYILNVWQMSNTYELNRADQRCYEYFFEHVFTSRLGLEGMKSILTTAKACPGILDKLWQLVALRSLLPLTLQDDKEAFCKLLEEESLAHLLVAQIHHNSEKRALKTAHTRELHKKSIESQTVSSFVWDLPNALFCKLSCEKQRDGKTNSYAKRCLKELIGRTKRTGRKKWDLASVANAYYHVDTNDVSDSEEEEEEA